MKDALEKRWIVYAIGIMVFFSLTRYYGFDGDAALYVLQVMNHLQPERFVNDVPFMFGNQDSFSIFSPIVAIIFKLLGVNYGGMTAVFVMLLAWAVLAAFFIRQWMKKYGAERYTPVLYLFFILLLVGKMYGSGSLPFPVIESYLVARVLSEVLIIAALACFFCKNRYISLIIFLLATFMHPLTAGWGLPLWLFYYYPKTRLPVVILSMLSPLTGFLHIGRLDFYTSDWISGQMFYKPEWNDILAYLSLLLFWFFMYKQSKELALSKFAISMFAISFIGFYLQYVGSLCEHVFIYQVQPFRVQWLSMIPVVPVFFIYLYNLYKNDGVRIKDLATVVVALCAIAQQNWLAVLLMALCLFVVKLGEKTTHIPKTKWINLLFVIGLLFLLLSSVLTNVVNLGLENGVGSTKVAFSLIRVPEYLFPVEKILLLVLAVICLIQNKWNFAFVFALSFCCTPLKILPIIGIVFYLVPPLGLSARNLLITLTGVLSYIEMLSSLHEVNSLNFSPIQGSPIGSLLLFVFLFVSVFLFLQNVQKINVVRIISLILVCVAIFVWNIFKWDGRETVISENEKQMDAFFETPIFPQVKNRGKLLFVVDYESPIQSRINFLTGAYADESIYVGEVFYKGQYQEANRRRNALLWGDLTTNDLRGFNDKILQVYKNIDALKSRVDFLCKENEISHLATDYSNIQLAKEDSVFLDVKKKYVYLYKCGT